MKELKFRGAKVRVYHHSSGVEYWVAPVKKGTIIMEVDNVSEEIAMEALEKAKFKLSIPCFVIKRKFAYL